MTISEIIKQLLDLFAPRPCACCGRRLNASEELLCANCNIEIPRTNFAKEPYDNPMAKLFWGRFPIEKAAAWMFYLSGNDTSELIKDIKYHGDWQQAEQLGYLIAEEFKPHRFFEGIDLIVPVPLTAARKRQRGYNQSMEIAVGVKRSTGIKIADKVLKRESFEASQTQKSAEERAKNVENAFSLQRPELIKGRHILLIDDVVTTGATVYECGKELAKAGDVKISVMSIGMAKT